MNQFVLAAAFAALLMGWTVSIVALQVTDNTPAPVIQNIERPPTACEQFEAASAFLRTGSAGEDASLLVLTAAGEAMGVPPLDSNFGTNASAAEAARRLGRMLTACTEEVGAAAP